MSRRCALLAVAAWLLVSPAPIAVATPQRNPLTVPPSPHLGPFSVERLGRWIRAVQGHDPGSADVYVQTIMQAYRGDLEGALRDFEVLRGALHGGGQSRIVPSWNGTVADALRATGLTEDDVAGHEIFKRGAILHTDIATSDAARATHNLDGVSEAPLAGMHLGIAATCVEYVKRELPLDPFVHQWYVSVAACLQRRNEVEAGPGFVDFALSLFPVDADLLMIQGYVQEYLACPHLPGSLDMARYDTSSATEHLKRAEQAYRRARRVGVGGAEIAMRLGRVVGLLGRHEEALSYLTPALEMPTDRDVHYFLLLFVGLEEAALDRNEPARQAYLRAQAIFPSAPSGYLALSHLARRRGDRAGAAAVLQAMLAFDANRTDPWLYYYGAGHRGLADRLLWALRAPLRKAKTP